MKDELREKLKIMRSQFQGEIRDNADYKIQNYFLKKFGGFESFFIYNSFAFEADTKKIIDKLLKAGKRVYLPRIDKEEMSAVPYGECVKGRFGIEEPVGKAFCGDIQVTVIPLLAVNSKGFRIGYGKGYYDRYLKDKHTIKVGLGYSFQMCAFEQDVWDIPLDLFVCEKGITVL